MTSTPAETIPIEFTTPTLHRTIECTIPEGDQAAVWTSIGSRIKKQEADWKTRREQAKNKPKAEKEKTEAEYAHWCAQALARFLAILESAVTHPADYEWLEDRIMGRECTLLEALTVLTKMNDGIGDRNKAEESVKPKPRKATRSR